MPLPYFCLEPSFQPSPVPYSTLGKDLGCTQRTGIQGAFVFRCLFYRPTCCLGSAGRKQRQTEGGRAGSKCSFGGPNLVSLRRGLWHQASAGLWELVAREDRGALTGPPEVIPQDSRASFLEQVVYIGPCSCPGHR